MDKLYLCKGKKKANFNVWDQGSIDFKKISHSGGITTIHCQSIDEFKRWKYPYHSLQESKMFDGPDEEDWDTFDVTMTTSEFESLIANN